MTQILERTVLFADLRGSTALYESLGNARATGVVTQSVALLSRTVQRCDGTVVKTLGDGLMAVFKHPRHAIAAADDMHDSLARIVAGNAASVDPLLAGRFPSLKLQVALARGEVIEMNGDCFGDAVNVAARLIDHAGDNETLATGSVLETLRDSEQARFRSISRIQLRGRVEPVQVHLLGAPRADSVATQIGDTAPTSEPDAIRLVCMDINRVFAGPKLPVVLGRSPQATYCIDDSRVSRSHARIDWHGGAFQLSDLSYNGTYVRFAHDQESIALRRGTCTLHGSGVIALGAPLTDPLAACVRFEVLRFADTQPGAVRGP